MGARRHRAALNRADVKSVLKTLRKNSVENVMEKTQQSWNIGRQA